MAKKTAARSKMAAGAKAAMAERSKDGKTAHAKPPVAKKSVAAKTKGATARRVGKSKPVESKPKAKKSTIGRAVGAVTSTVSGVAESTASLFRRGRRAEKNS